MCYWTISLDLTLENSLVSYHLHRVTKSSHVAADKSTRRATVGRSRGQFSIELPAGRSITRFQSTTRARSSERRGVRTSKCQCGIADQRQVGRLTLIRQLAPNAAGIWRVTLIRICLPTLVFLARYKYSATFYCHFETSNRISLMTYCSLSI